MKQDNYLMKLRFSTIIELKDAPKSNIVTLSYRAEMIRLGIFKQVPLYGTNHLHTFEFYNYPYGYYYTG